MFKMRPALRSRSPRTLATFGGALCLTLAPMAVTPSSLAQPISDAASLTGTDFAGVRYGLAPIDGDVQFSALRTYSFGDASCRRLVLIGDVRLKLSTYSLAAKRAAVWIQRLPDSQAEQMFIFLDEVGAPEDSVANTSFTASTLPVKAVIRPRDGILLRTSLVVKTSPADDGTFPADAAFDQRAQEQFVRSLRREMGLDAPPAETPPSESTSSGADEAGTTQGLEPRMIKQREQQRQARRDAGLPDPYFPPPVPQQRIARTPKPAQRGGGAIIGPSNRSARTSGAAGATATNSGASGASGAGPARAGTDGAGPRATTSPSTRTPPSGDQRLARETNTPAESAAAPASDQGRIIPPTIAATPLASAGRAPIFQPTGVLTLSPGNVSFVSGEEENSVIASGGVTLQYTDPTGRVLQLTAQRVVIFLDPGSVQESLQFGTDAVRGIYLEGNVLASDGQYSLRAPQVYYDIRANKAVSLDAVFWTYDESRKLPIYVRAKAIHQEASQQFSAKNAKLTNTAFFDPELSIGASSVTITKETIREPRKGEVAQNQPRQRTVVAAKDIVPRFAGVPVFYLPSYEGDPDRFPIKDLRIENFSGSGAAVRTVLDLYAIVGLEKSRKFQADLLADFYVERGFGIGTRLGWETDTSEGALLAWTLPDDRGVDVFKPGTEANRDGEFRGIFLAEHRQRLDNKWTLYAEGAILSDEAIVDAFFEGLGETRREFTNRLAAQRIDKNTALTLEAKASANDFIANEFLLQSQGYSVSKLPELRYSRLADDLFRSRPGLFSYFSEYRAGLIQMNFDDVEARDRGLTNNTLSQRALGINFDERLSDVFEARGLTDEPVLRADTRQEITATLNAGPVKINPFVVARATAYDTEFDDYAPDQSEQGRLWSAAGVRVSSTIQRVFDEADSRIFDVHRLRHIIEPNATFWASGTNLEADNLPVYDSDVESLADGTMIKVGMTQYFQTQRGAPGEWHNTDLLTISTDFVWSSDDNESQGPLGRFVDYRPELSNPGEYFIGEAAWRATDAVTFTGSTIYDFDINKQATSSTGVLIQHTPEFMTAAELRYLNVQDSTLVTLGAKYVLTTKYDLFAGADYDIDEGGFQNTSFEVHRRFPSAVFGVGIAYNDITGESSLSFVFRPWGVSGEGRFSGIGASNPNAVRSGVGGF